MSFFQASEAPIIPTTALYIYLIILAIFTSKSAVGSRTPFTVFPFVNERFFEIMLISIEQILREELFEDLRRNYKFTTLHWARGEYGIWSLPHVLF